MGGIHLAGAKLTLWAPLVLIGLGLVNCFFGYRFFKVLLGLWGFVAGLAVGLAVARQMHLDPVPQLFCALVVGLIGAALVSVLYLLGVFLFGAGFGSMVASALLQSWPQLSAWPTVLILALLGGAAALALQRPLIMIFTAFGGAWVVVSGVAALVGGCPLESLPSRCPITTLGGAPVALGIWLVLSLLGLASQGRHPRRDKRHDED
jgi:hypothetical protein